MPGLSTFCSISRLLSASICISLVGYLLSARVVNVANAQLAPSDQGGNVSLEPGKRISQSVSGTEVHRYELKLQDGQCASVEVEQRGIDVSVQLLVGESDLLAEADDELGKRGTEKLDIVADHSGSYTIAVKPKWKVTDGAYEVRLAGVRAASEQDRSLYEARQLRTKAKHLFLADKHQEALPLAERALNIEEQVLGADDLYVAVLTRELAEINYNMSKNREARDGFERAVKTLIAKAGPEHPQTLFAKSRLGSVYIAMGEYSKADTILSETLEGEERVFGEDDPNVAGTLKSLAFLHESRKDAAKAEQEDLRGLAILESLGLTEQNAYAEFLNNLGIIYQDLDEFDKAKTYFELGLAHQERRLGAESLELSRVLNNLGILARRRKDYPAAEKYLLRTVAIKEKWLGAEHPEYAGALMNLANVYASEGDHRKALQTHLRVLGIYEKGVPPGEFPPIPALANVAREYAALGDLENAKRAQARFDAALEQDIEFNLAIGSERQKLSYLDYVEQRTARTISLNLQLEPGDSQVTALASTVLLQRKGRLLDAMTDSLATLRKHSDAQDQVLLDELKEASTELARVSLRGPQKQSLAEYVKALRDLQDRKEKLESAIGHRNEEFRARSKTVSLEAVRDAVPKGAALLEFVAYRPFNPKGQTDAEQYGNLRYGVYVLHRTGAPCGIDLGEANAIDALVEKLRTELREPNQSDVRQQAQTLADKVFRPIESLVASDERLLISPDGQLNLIPFEALLDQQGRYLLERFSITYLTTGRDLLRMQLPRPSKSAPVLVADPLFGEPNENLVASAATPKAKVAVAGTARRSITTGADFASFYFAPLEGTKAEAQKIQALFPDARVLTGEQASEAALEELNAPEILHIATHGFFLQDSAQGKEGNNATVNPENPLLRSGLALSGANLSQDSKGRGILTALQASNLDLWGTKLVTLSACDTGVGEVRNGEGVYGLRRAFFLAGTESLVMSLWPVSDYVTRELMTEYYTGLKKGLGRGEALRQAQLSMLKRKGRQHPFYWASFIQAGEWANLDGKR